MKNFGIVILGFSLALHACQTEIDATNLEALKSAKKEMTIVFKSDKKFYESEMNWLDSAINAHPDNKFAVLEIKTVPVTVKSVELKTFEHFFEVLENISVFRRIFGKFRKFLVDSERQGCEEELHRYSFEL